MKIKDCIFCKKAGDGFICRHCLAKGGSQAGKAAKVGGKYLGMAAPFLLAAAGKKFKK